MSKRAIYAVYGESKYLSEATRSARSLREHCPNCEIVAYAARGCIPDLDTDAFDQVVAVDLSIRGSLKLDFAIKLEAIKRGLTDYTLFIDTDTLVCNNLDDAWELLNRFDVLACHAPYRRRLRYENFEEPTFVSEVPSAFCELNTGVIFLRDNNRTRSFIEAWYDLYEREPSSGDQYLFMDTLYKSDCSLYVLPPEFNYRMTIPGFACDPIRIVHAHHPDLEGAAMRLNASTVPRVSMLRRGELELWAPASTAPQPPQK